jgi:hypothetical protein
VNLHPGSLRAAGGAGGGGGGGLCAIDRTRNLCPAQDFEDEKTVCFVLRLAAIQVSQEENITLIYIVEGQ